MLSFHMVLQGGFTKFPSIICLWDSPDTKAVSQKGLATTDRVLYGQEQFEMGATDRTSESAYATTSHQVMPHQAIYHCS